MVNQACLRFLLDVSVWEAEGMGNLLPLVGMVGAAPVGVAAADLHSRLGRGGAANGEAVARERMLASVRPLRMVDIEGILRWLGVVSWKKRFRDVFYEQQEEGVLEQTEIVCERVEFECQYEMEIYNIRLV